MSDNPTPPPAPDFCPRCKLQNEAKLPFCKQCGFDLFYGRTKKPTKGHCAFCEKYRKLSEEHIFPDWLRKVYPLRFSGTGHVLVRPERHVFWEDVPKHLGKGVNDNKPNLYATTVKNVCEKCNNGWMARLQNEAKPLIERFANGEWLVLDATQRTILVRWCAMTTMNIEYWNIVTIPQFQRASLMNGEMPVGWRVSLASVIDVRAAGAHFHRIIQYPIGIGNGEFIKAQSTYFCIEKIAFYCFSTSGNGVLGLLSFLQPEDFHERYGLRII